MKIHPFKAIYPNFDLIASADSFIATVKLEYANYMTSGFFKQTDQDAIYIQQIQKGGMVHYGIIASNNISDLKNNKIIKHEHTLAAKEQRMMNLTLQRNAMVKPILLAYDAVEEIDTFIAKITKDQEPFYSVFLEETNEKHTIWAVSDKADIEKLKKVFQAKVHKSYIADGHHRCATALKLHETGHLGSTKKRLEHFLVVYFAFKDLLIYDYNRVLNIFKDISPVKFMAALSKYFNIDAVEAGSKPKKKFEITMYLEEQWYLLKWKESILSAYEKKKVLLDAFLFDKFILENILNVTDIRTDTRLKYVEGTLGAEGIVDVVDRNENRVGFCLYPVHYKEMKSVADMGETLPPKSTWFEPRIRNGLVVEAF